MIMSLYQAECLAYCKWLINICEKDDELWRLEEK